MMKLSPLELDVASDILNIALAKAADSLSFFTKVKLLVKSTDIEIESIKKINPLSKKEKGKHILMTRLRGDLPGTCFLILNEIEAQELWKVSLPASMLGDTAANHEAKTGFLKEIDNIITAAVVTQFSNFLKLKLYGDVPEYVQVDNKVDLDDFVRESIDDNAAMIHFDTCFATDEINFSPEFIWVLDDKFLVMIKKLAG